MRSMLCRGWVRVGLALVAGLWGSAVAAADYCVASTAQLRTALEAAAASAEDDVIKLVRGDYAFTDSGLSVSPIKGGLVLRGGHASGCPVLGRSLDPATTRLYSSTPQARGISLSPGSGADLEIDGLSFVDLMAVSLTAAGNLPTAASGRIWVRRSRFIGNRRGLDVFSAHKDVRIENCVFLDNESLGFHGTDDDIALTITHLAAAQAPISVDVLFNTVLGSRRALWIEGGGPFESNPRVQNNILRSTLAGTDPYALRVDAAQVAATNNIWGPVLATGGGAVSTNLLNVDADPQLGAGWVPTAGSPALNSGTDFVAGGVPATDHDGGPRTVGSRPDRGALESAISDISVITVTSTANSGPGTLRQAILDSNASSNAETIAFNLGPAGGCPYEIVPDTALPAVTSPLTIDGFTQPGSAPNSRFDRYDGTHCVVLRGDVAQGLRLRPAANQAMAVRGLAFQRFSAAAIDVDGAGRATIQGNTFGVTTNALLPAAFAGDAIAISGTTGSYVGGTDAESINLIGNAAGTGLRLAGCSACAARNNLIGVKVDGHSDLGNGVGVLAVDGDGAITDNVIGHSGTQGLRIEGAAASYTVMSNQVGIAKVFLPDNLTRRPAPNGTNGIRLVAGIEHRVSSNRIAHNGTDGLVVLDAVDSAYLRANRIYGNGQLGIDLSPDGVDPQESDLVDAGGGNAGQNYPELLEASGSNGNGTVTGVLPSSTGTFEIEVYASAACDGSGHGEGERWIGRGTVSITATGSGGAPAEDTVPFSIAVSSAVGTNLGLLGRFITATATRLGPLGSGATSEFSACIPYQQGPALFSDSFEP